jgi:hypothetical protein
MKFRCGRGDIKDLAFGVLCLRELSEAELRACLNGGSCAEAENTARRMALKIFSEHRPYLNFIEQKSIS